MKLINLFFLFFLASCSSSSQHVCEIDTVLVDFLNTDVPYSIDKDNVDLTNVFNNRKVAYIGFVGENKKKLDFNIISIQRDSKNLLRYLVKGKTKIYSEKVKFFTGEFLLERQYKFSEKLDEDISHNNEILKQGFSILDYELNEDNNIKNAGVFKGKILISWYIDTSNKSNYDDTLDYIPSYTNCYFFGNWVGNNKNQKLLTSWSHYRIPCSGDLDIGAAEFSPNPKYNNQGWETYNSEISIEEEVIENQNNISAKIVDNDGYVNMRKEKSKHAKIIIKVESGEHVTILNQKEDWWFVLYKNKRGYIHKSRLKLIK